MGRAGYSEDYDCDYDQWSAIRWGGMLASSIRGRRGQAFLRELLDALEAMSDKRLITEDLRRETGEVCTLGSIGARRGVDLESLDPEDHETLGATFNIATPLVREIEFQNDEISWRETPEQRWARMRQWVAAQLKASTQDGSS